MSNIRDQLIAEIDDFLLRTGMPQTTLAKAAVRDPGWITRLRSGDLDPRIGTVEEMRAYMAAHKVEGPCPRCRRPFDDSPPVRPRSRSSASSQVRRERKR